MNQPYCLAMVLCDGVHCDRTTGKCTLLGTFSTVASNSYPASFVLAVYFALTELQGRHTLTFRIVDSHELFQDDAHPILSANAGIEADDPLGVHEGHLGIQFALPKPGVYHCELLIEDDVLMSRRLLAVGPSPEDTGDEDAHLR